MGLSDNSQVLLLHKCGDFNPPKHPLPQKCKTKLATQTDSPKGSMPYYCVGKVVETFNDLKKTFLFQIPACTNGGLAVIPFIIFLTNKTESPVSNTAVKPNHLCLFEKSFILLQVPSRYFFQLFARYDFNAVAICI